MSSAILSPACGPGGDGWCFGRTLAGEWCECGCHLEDDPPSTKEEALVWHSTAHSPFSV
jgi:hypothetical protein